MARNAFMAATLLAGTTFQTPRNVRTVLRPPTIERQVTPVVEGEQRLNEAREQELNAVTDHFRARLEVAGLASAWPEQNFSVLYPTQNRVILEGERSYPWPQIKIDLEVDDAGKPKAILGVHLEPASNTVDAEIYYTRVAFMLVKDGFCLLRDLDRDTELKFKVRAQEDDWFLIRSMLARKMKFLEKVFGVRFRLPEESRWGDARGVEVAFRGVTEGEFSTRRRVFTLGDFTPAPGEMDRSPFTAPGAFDHTFEDGLQVFNRRLDVGRVAVHLGRAEAFDLDKLEPLRNGLLRSGDVSFLVLDRQVHYRFLNYEARTADLSRQLEEFRGQLLRKEPQGLVDLLAVPLESPVAAEEAEEIVIGWLRYYGFPDGFWPQAAELEAGRWKVPVWIAYPDGKGAPVENLYVDVVSGKVEDTVPPEELLSKGESVAESLLRAG